MKITIIANGFQEHYIYNLLNSLADKDTQVDFIGSDIYLKDSLDERINFLNLRGSHSEDVFVLIKLIRIVKYYLKLSLYLLKTSSEVVHIQWYRFTFLEGVLISLFARILRKKAVYTAHDVLPHDRGHLLNRINFWFIYRFQSCIVVHTQYIKNRLIKEFGISSKKIYVVKHGVYSVKPEAAGMKQEARNELNLKASEFVFLFFGYIAKYKGLHLLLEAFSGLDDKAQIKLIIAGKVSEEYKDEYAQLIEKFASSRIFSVNRFISDEEVDRFFRAADATVLPYTEASQSGVLFMSYAYGRPVIAPNLGGFPYDIVSGDTGYLFEAGNIHDLRAKLKLLENEWHDRNTEDYKKIAEYARVNYSWDGSANALIDIYSKR